MVAEIRLGWLQRFCAVATHESFVDAAEACNVDATSLADSIKSLETNIGRLLVHPTTAHLSASGRAFLSTAITITEMSKEYNKNITNIKIGWLLSLISFSETGNYAQTAKHLGCNRFRVMRHLRLLRDWVGDEIVYLRGECLGVTDRGEALISSSRSIIDMLERWHDPDNDVHRHRGNNRIRPWYFWYLFLKKR